MTQRFIPYGRQTIDNDDIDAVVEVLKSDFLTQGPTVDLFEEKLSEYTGAKYAVTLSNATSSLHICCLALGLGFGDFLWTSVITFVASANCAKYCGAQVDLVDINPDTFNVDVEALEKKLKIAEKNGTLPKIIVPVHMAGQPADMVEIFNLSKKYGFKIVEDASHALGAKYKDHPVGNCLYSDMTVFSFHPLKNITTGEGGCITTNCELIYNKIKLLRSHGINKENSLFMNESHGGWYYEQIDLGYNYRMTDIQAALGVSQLKKLDHFISSRNLIAERYQNLLSNLSLRLPVIISDRNSAFHLYVVRFPEDKYSKKLIFSEMRKKGIGVNLHYIPIYKQPYYKYLGYSDKDFPHAAKYYKEAISFPIYPGLSEDDQFYVVKNLLETLKLSEI